MLESSLRYGRGFVIKYITRNEARELGLKRYMDGLPCVHGHICERLVVNAGCIECKQVSQRAWTERNFDKKREKDKLYRETHKEELNSWFLKYRETHREELREKARIYSEPRRKLLAERSREYARNHRKELNEKRRIINAANPELNRKRARSWAKANPGRRQAIACNHIAAKLKAIPAWADFDKINDFYEKSSKLTKETGIQYNVDHYYPLQGDTVCGLHVHSNLQIITRIENSSKNNKHPEEFYGDDYVV